MIAFYGMGLLGSNFVRALRRHGEDVKVWNRTAAKAAALEPLGAKVVADPAEAARGAQRIHLTLADDAAVDDVLERARPGFAQGAIIVDHTTTSPKGVVARVARWTERGFVFVHAPVFMGPQNALESTGLMLVSGDPKRVGAVKSDLEKMTGTLLNLGPRVDKAAAFKLLGNLYLMSITTGLAEMFALGKALEIPASEAATLFQHFNPGATISARVKRMLEAKFGSPSWELSMARKDARLMIDAASEAGMPLAILPAIAKRMDAVIAEGHGNEDWTILAKDALE